MKKTGAIMALWLSMGLASLAQNTFTVTGTPVPPALLRENYGRIPKGVAAFDLSICNTTDTKQSIVSSELYQALAKADDTTLPVGKQIMLGAILNSQSHSASNILNIALNSATSVLSILSSRSGSARGLTTAAAIGTVSAQQIFANFKPLLSSDQVQKFENEVLEPALVLDSGSCVERTVFTLRVGSQTSSKGLSFHVR